MADLPTGTVTLLFTDIEGSTLLVHRLGERYAQVLTEHRRLLRAAFDAHRGREVDTEGDAFFVAFVDAREALAAALEAQRALMRFPWPDGIALRVRMGIHTGTPTRTDEGYVGIDLVRAARVASAANGGQVLLTAATAELVRFGLPAGAHLRDLGPHRLKDLPEPEHLFQMVADGVLSDFAPVRSLPGGASNLPGQATSFVGREREVEEIRALLRSTRVLTLIGPGGIGKTRIALEVAGGLSETYRHGIWLVELAALTDPALVPNAVAEAVGVKEQPGRPMGATLADALSSRQLLIILDNCEYLVAACAGLAAEVVTHCPLVSILTTSREALRIPAERLYPVPSLTVPEGPRLPPVEELREIEATRLFEERARAVSPRFTLDARNAAAVAEICRRLDGLPLALELAAARVRVLTPAEIAQRLGDRFRLLSAGSRLAPPRQQTLWAAIDWGYQLLDDPERLVLRRLSVFMGGWTLEAASAVCADEASGDDDAVAGVDRVELLDRITGLVDKSFVFAQPGEMQTRYGMLETIRQYAAAKLDEAGETTAAQMRHRDWYLALPDRVRAEAEGSDQTGRLAKLEAEHDNLRAAIECSLAHAEDAELGLRLATALEGVWYIHGHYREGFQTLERAIRAAPRAPGILRTAALRSACHLAGFLGELSRAVELGTEAIELARELRDDLALSRALYNLANVERTLGAYDRVVAHVEEGIVLARRAGRERDVANGFGYLGQAACDRGDYERSVELFTEALAIHHSGGDRQREAWILDCLAEVMVELRDYDRASTLCRAARALAEDLQDRSRLAWLCQLEGTLAREQGDLQAAWTLLGEALSRFDELGDAVDVALCARELAATATADGRPQEAARLLASEAALRESAGWTLTPALALRRDRYLAEARAALGEEVFAAAWAEGRAMRLQDAVAAIMATGA